MWSMGWVGRWRLCSGSPAVACVGRRTKKEKMVLVSVERDATKGRRGRGAEGTRVEP